MATAACPRPGAPANSLSRWERAASHSLSPWERAGVRASRRGAFTLLELLVAMALTLLLVYALAQFYSYVGDTVRDGRAIVEMGGDIRNAIRQLRDDLNSLTVHPKPPVDDGRGAGFLEIVEGRQNDLDINGNGTAELAPNVLPLFAEGYDLNNDGVMDQGTMLGDMDDILSMTIRTSGGPFVGRRYNATTSAHETIESNLAEVVWFTTFKDLNAPGDPGYGSWQLDEPRFLVRRLLLIRPDIASSALATPALGPNENFFHHNDISVHRDTVAGTWVANSLSDLTRRENRFIHLNLQQVNRNGLRAAETTMMFPNPNTAAYMPNPLWLMVNVGGRPNNQISNNQMAVDQYTLQRTQDPNTGAVADFTGEDLILPNLLAFDIRVYDPTVPLYGDNLDVPGAGNDTPATNDDALASLQPGDPGYATASANNEIAGYGAYVDLWHNRVTGLNLTTYFSTFPSNRSNSYFPDGLNTTVIANYDTWTTFYERDTYDQDTDMVADEGTDGLDNDGQNGVDDPAEHETSPPYLAPLRGIQVRVRMYEPGTRQTRQATVVADFVAE